jgi:hypothetical protein
MEEMHVEMSMQGPTAAKRKFGHKNLKSIKFHQANEKYRLTYFSVVYFEQI